MPINLLLSADSLLLLLSSEMAAQQISQWLSHNCLASDCVQWWVCLDSLVSSVHPQVKKLLSIFWNTPKGMKTLLAILRSPKVVCFIKTHLWPYLLSHPEENLKIQRLNSFWCFHWPKGHNSFCPVQFSLLLSEQRPWAVKRKGWGAATKATFSLNDWRTCLDTGLPCKSENIQH